MTYIINDKWAENGMIRYVHAGNCEKSLAVAVKEIPKKQGKTFDEVIYNKIIKSKGKEIWKTLGLNPK